VGDSLSKAAYQLACQCQLRATAKAVLKELAWFADDKGERIWPSVRTLAERTGMGRRTVQKILRELEREGAIQALGSRLGGRHRTTRYRMVLAWFEAACKETKGERHDAERANGSAEKGEPRAPEQKEHEYEKYSKSPSNEGKTDPTRAYEQQRTLQAARSLAKNKSFPHHLSGAKLQDRKLEAKAKLAVFEQQRQNGAA
jgi:DNA-binding transcriptional MocR family regulator